MVKFYAPWCQHCQVRALPSADLSLVVPALVMCVVMYLVCAGCTTTAFHCPFAICHCLVHRTARDSPPLHSFSQDDSL